LPENNHLKFYVGEKVTRYSIMYAVLKSPVSTKNHNDDSIDTPIKQNGKCKPRKSSNLDFIQFSSIVIANGGLAAVQ
jgi:hypothetical protein